MRQEYRIVSNWPVNSARSGVSKGWIMTSQEQETSPSGARIYRYKEPSRGWVPASPDVNQEDIEHHIEKWVGGFESVYHELASDLVHIDVVFVEPSAERNFYTLVTSGMSSRAMRAPESAQGCEYAELSICLPPDWPLGQSDFKDDRNYWPVRALKYLARFPHKYDAWLWWGHTIPNGDPPQPFADNTKLCGMILAPPVLLPDGFFQLHVSAD